MKEAVTKCRGVCFPKAAFVQSVRETMDAFPGHCTDNWQEEERSFCRNRLVENTGQESWRAVETDIIGRAATNMRKAKQLDSVNGGPKRKKHVPPDGRYAEYLATEGWQRFRLVVLDFWGGKCCLCNEKAQDVHHRTYERVNKILLEGNEKLTDCVALCRRCHKSHHGKMADGNVFFNVSEGNADA